MNVSAAMNISRNDESKIEARTPPAYEWDVRPRPLQFPG